MKKILKYSLIVSLCAAMVSLTGCQKKEQLSTDPLREAFSFAGIAPNPVMRGGAINIYGRGLDQVAEVHFAGENISVSDFVKLSKGAKLDTLQLIVPLEGPEVGKVSIVTVDGRSLVSKTDLSFTEPIEIENISPRAVVSRDVITITGEYLNVVKEIIFTGENAVATEFESQSRHELKVKVPASAVDGPIILSDVNELTDQSTIPNHVYSAQELVLGQPTVKKAAKATYKVGDKMTVTGSHLDMIKAVNLPGAEAVEFSYKQEGGTESIEFTLPATALAGTITLVSFEADEFDGGEYDVVLPTNVVAAPQPVKAGAELTITGKDLDLVSKINLEKAAEVEFTYEDDKITLTVPEAAQEGDAVLVLASGVEIPFTFTLVKPVVTGFSANPVPAGSTLTIEGTNLDLVASVTFGGDVTVEVEAGEKSITVDVPTAAESGKLVLNLKNGSSLESEDLGVDKPAGAFLLSVPEDIFKIGDIIVAEVVNGEHLEKVLFDAIEAKFMVNGDKLCVFVPEGAKKGSLLVLVSDNGTVSYPVNIDPGTQEAFVIWSGNEDLGSWSNQPYVGQFGFLLEHPEFVPGDVIRFSVVPNAESWQFQIYDGNWGGQLCTAPTSATCPDGIFDLVLDQALIDKLNGLQNWGGLFVVQGENCSIVQISAIHYIPQETAIWEGSEDMGSWSNQPYVGEFGALAKYNITEGNWIRFYITPNAESWQLQIYDGNWGGQICTAPSAENCPDGVFDLVLDQATIDKLNGLQNWGGLFVVQGENCTLTKISLFFPVKD